MSDPSARGHRPASFQLALVFSLLVFAVIVAIAWMLTLVLPVPAHSAQATVTAVPGAISTPRPTRTSSPTPVRRATRTPRPTHTPVRTSTRSPLFESPLPGMTASPAGEVARCEETTGSVVEEMYSSRLSDDEQHYLVYLPPCSELSSRRYPAIYLLHGSENDDTHWERLGVFQAMDQGLAEGRLAPAIIVLPDGDPDLFINTSGGPNSFEAQIVDELVPIVDRLFKTDPRPQMRAIGGISRGGVWSLEIGFLNPESFSIVAGHSPCLNVNEAPPEYDPLKLSDRPSLKSQRIWLDAGKMDYCQPGAEDLHMALGASGVAHDYHIWSGVHDDALWAEHVSAYLEFYTLNWPK
jgi:enterochelin esterase-like enzyme